jgi:hypothetical protein
MNLTMPEMQKALVLWGRDTFAKRMGITPRDLPAFCRSKGLLPPTDALRKQAEDKETPVEDIMMTISKNKIARFAVARVEVADATLTVVIEGLQVTVRRVLAEQLDLAVVKDTAVWMGSETEGRMGIGWPIPLKLRV